MTMSEMESNLFQELRIGVLFDAQGLWILQRDMVGGARESVRDLEEKRRRGREIGSPDA